MTVKHHITDQRSFNLNTLVSLLDGRLGVLVELDTEVATSRRKHLMHRMELNAANFL